MAQPPAQRRPSNSGRRQKAARSRTDRGSDRAGERSAEHPDHQEHIGITHVDLPLFVYGYGSDGVPFYEQAKTIATHARGGLISMHTTVQPGQRLLITNKENECSQECVVEFLGAQLARGIDVGFEFSAPTPEFWHVADVEHPPAGEGERVAEADHNPSENEKACA